jgi:HD-GYP domain-containing protein (c-di-GMP phosphodiesterase class II)
MINQRDRYQALSTLIIELNIARRNCSSYPEGHPVIDSSLHKVLGVYKRVLETRELSDEEFDLMKSHPVKGARYLLDNPGVPRMAAITAYEHHAKYNLGGYPKLPSDWRQTLCSHMTTISDIFDALRTRRSYREQISAMMESMMGSDLHPQMTSNFLNIIPGLAN